MACIISLCVDTTQSLLNNNNMTVEGNISDHMYRGHVSSVQVSVPKFRNIESSAAQSSASRSSAQYSAHTDMGHLSPAPPRTSTAALQNQPYTVPQQSHQHSYRFSDQDTGHVVSPRTRRPTNEHTAVASSAATQTPAGKSSEFHAETPALT